MAELGGAKFYLQCIWVHSLGSDAKLGCSSVNSKPILGSNQNQLLPPLIMPKLFLLECLKISINGKCLKYKFGKMAKKHLYIN